MTFKLTYTSSDGSPKTMVVDDHGLIIASDNVSFLKNISEECNGLYQSGHYKCRSHVNVKEILEYLDENGYDRRIVGYTLEIQIPIITKHEAEGYAEYGHGPSKQVVEISYQSISIPMNEIIEIYNENKPATLESMKETIDANRKKTGGYKKPKSSPKKSRSSPKKPKTSPKKSPKKPKSSPKKPKKSPRKK